MNKAKSWLDSEIITRLPRCYGVGGTSIVVDVSFIIGGPQGGGIESAGQIALKAFVLKGYNVLGTREYHSNIMGAHSYFHVRVREDRPGSVTRPVHALLALDAESVFTHLDDVMEGGLLVYDPSTNRQSVDSIQPMAKPLKDRLRKLFAERGMKPTVDSAVKVLQERGVTVVGVPLKALLKRVAEETKKPPASVAKTANTLGLTILLYMLGVEPEYVESAIRAQFAGREKIIAPNVVAMKVAVEYVSEVYGKARPIPDGPHKGRVRMIASGNEVVAMAKIAAGLGFLSYYPITPSSDEALYVEKYRSIDLGDKAGSLGYERLNVVVIQSEDELAAINMAIGAAMAGARASTTTSGPGFSLMNEGMSYAVMAEVPLVVTLWMRAGPSTGMPTRTGQQDLLHSLYSGHGDAPKIVVASGDHLEAFMDAMKAFNWAEKYQTPVIHLLDKYLASAMASLDREDLDPGRVVIERGKVAPKGRGGYKRYEITEDGISPRLPLGAATMIQTGLEHTEEGAATEDPVAREEMMWKRKRKMETIAREIPEEGERAVLHGDEDARITIVSFGSTKLPILEAMRILEGEGVRVKFLQIRMFNPFPESFARSVLEDSDIVIGVEQNIELQMRFAVRGYTGIDIPHSIIKINGRPIYDYEIAWGVRRILDTRERLVVVSGGA